MIEFRSFSWKFVGGFAVAEGKHQCSIHSSWVMDSVGPQGFRSSGSCFVVTSAMTWRPVGIVVLLVDVSDSVSTAWCRLGVRIVRDCCRRLYFQFHFRLLASKRKWFSLFDLYVTDSIYCTNLAAKCFINFLMQTADQFRNWKWRNLASECFFQLLNPLFAISTVTYNCI